MKNYNKKKKKCYGLLFFTCGDMTDHDFKAGLALMNVSTSDLPFDKFFYTAGKWHVLIFHFILWLPM